MPSGEKSSGSDAVENCTDFSACNHTELYQLCIHAGVNVTPNMDKALLLAALDGVLEVQDTNSVNEWRDGLMTYLLERWRRVQGQLFCPAKSGDPHACYGCIDAQVVHCLNTNPQIASDVAKYIERKKRGQQ